ncbi:MAG: hypothetical protein QM759_12465 [Terricaulis sp.]
MSRNSDKRIEQAIENGQSNLRTMELVRNWCAHASITKMGGGGLIEAHTGLPIGHHGLSCPHASAGGMMTWDLRDAAIDFYDRNCHDCKLRKPVGLPNISSLISERDAREATARAARKNTDDRIAAALATRDSVRAGLRAALDPPAASHVDLLADLDHARGERVSERLVEAARLAPETFPPGLIEHLFAMIEGRVYALVETSLRVLNVLAVDPRRLCNCALIALGNHSAIEIAGSIVARLAHDADEASVFAAVPAMISLARPARGSFMDGASVTDDRPLRLLYTLHPDRVRAGFDELFSKPKTYLVAQAARGITVLQDVDPALGAHYARTLAAKLVRKTHLLPDLSEYDDSLYAIRTPLLAAFLFDPQTVDAILQSLIAGAADEGLNEIYHLYASALRETRFDETPALTPAHAIAFQKLIWAAAESPSSPAAEEAQQVFSRLPDFLRPLAVQQLDQLLGAAAIVDDKLTEFDRSAKASARDQLSYLEGMNFRARARRLQSGFLAWACSAAGQDIIAIRKVTGFLASLPDDRERLRGEVIAHLGGMAQSAEALNEILPSLYSAMLGPSTTLRASAANAIEDLKHEVSQNLPELIYEALVAQLSDPFVAVHRAAFRVLDRSRFPASLDAQVTRCLSNLILAYSQGRDSDDFLLSCIDLFVRRYAPNDRISGSLGARLVEILNTIAKEDVARKVRFLDAHLREAPGYVTLLCRLLTSEEALEYHGDDMAAALQQLSAAQILAHIDALQATARNLPEHRKYMCGHILEAFARAGAWDAALDCATAHESSIDDTIRDRPRKLLARLHRLACAYEQSIAVGNLQALPALSAEWTETARAIEHDHETNKKRRDPLHGLLSKD